MNRFLARIAAWLTAGYPEGVPGPDRVPLLALLTRRWTLAWIALAGTTVACPAGMLAVWSRQTATGHPGPGIGLIIGWLAVIVLTFHWARVVWARSTYHLALEEERRRESAAREDAARRLTGRTITRPSDIPREDGTPGTS